MTDIHSSANSKVLRNAVSPDALEAALRANEAAERLTKDEDHQANGALDRRPNEPAHCPSARSEQTSRSPQVAWTAATAIAEGGQDVLQAWLELAQNAVRTNVEALSRLAECRSWAEMMTVQSSVLQERVRQSVACGEAIVRASTLSIRQTEQAMHGAEPPGQRLS